MEEIDELFRTENDGRRVRVKRIAETYSDKTHRVREQIFDTEGEQRMLEDKRYLIDAQGKQIEDQSQLTGE